MRLTFIPKKKSIAAIFEAGDNASGQTDPGNNVTVGSRKAPQQHHFYSEIRVNPDAKALILRPRVTLTRYASEWQTINNDRFIIQDTSTLGICIYNLMGWNYAWAYSIPGTVVAPHLVSVAGREKAGREAINPDTARIGDYFFNLKVAVHIVPDYDHQTYIIEEI